MLYGTVSGTILNDTWVTWGAGRVPVGVSSGDADFGTVNKTGGDKTVTLNIDQMPSHIHKYTETILDYTIAHSSGGSNFHIKGNQASNVTSAGGNKAHTNLQPYVTCYMWRRTV